MSKEKKAFKDTLFGKIVNKAAHVIPDVAGIALQAATGDIKGAIQNLKGQLIDSSLGGSIKAQPILDELHLQLKQIELEFARVDLEETQAYLADTQNARSKEISMIQAGASNWFQYLVGCVGLAMLGFCLYVLVYVVIPEQNRDLFLHFLGIIEGIAISIFTYEFGSSKGSKEKTKLMGK